MVQLGNSIHMILQNCNQIPFTIFGDFNLDVTDGKHKVFCDLMRTKYNCFQYVTQPTTNDQTTIDLIFSNHPHQYTFTIDCYQSNHKLLCTVIDLIQSKNNTGIRR